MKIERKFSYWTLFNASYRGHETCFALTNHTSAEPLLELSSEVNSDYKIIIMPIEENAKTPSRGEFRKMEEYFWHEGHMEYLELWYNWLNSHSFRFTDKTLEKSLKNAPSLINKWWVNEAIEQYKEDDYI